MPKENLFKVVEVVFPRLSNAILLIEDIPLYRLSGHKPNDAGVFEGFLWSKNYPLLYPIYSTISSIDFTIRDPRDPTNWDTYTKQFHVENFIYSPEFKLNLKKHFMDPNDVHFQKNGNALVLETEYKKCHLVYSLEKREHFVIDANPNNFSIVTDDSWSSYYDYVSTEMSIKLMELGLLVKLSNPKNRNLYKHIMQTIQSSFESIISSE